MTRNIKRWETMDRTFIVVISLILAFAWMDSKQIVPFLTINTPEAWDLYNAYTGPAIWWLWYVVVLSIGIIWYIIYNDKSESVALVASGWALIWFGTQDIFYFIFSEQVMTSCMCWADSIPTVKLISDLLKEACPSATSFIISAVIGVFVSYKLYNYFKRIRTW